MRDIGDVVLALSVIALVLWMNYQLRDIRNYEPLPEPARTCEVMATKYRCVIIRGFDGYGRDYEVETWCHD